MPHMHGHCNACPVAALDAVSRGTTPHSPICSSRHRQWSHVVSRHTHRPLCPAVGGQDKSWPLLLRVPGPRAPRGFEHKLHVTTSPSTARALAIRAVI